MEIRLNWTSSEVESHHLVTPCRCTHTTWMPSVEIMHFFTLKVHPRHHSCHVSGPHGTWVVSWLPLWCGFLFFHLQTLHSRAWFFLFDHFAFKYLFSCNVGQKPHHTHQIHPSYCIFPLFQASKVPCNHGASTGTLTCCLTLLGRWNLNPPSYVWTHIKPKYNKTHPWALKGILPKEN